MIQPKDIDWLNEYKSKIHTHTHTHICICCLQETHFSSRDTYTLKVRGWKEIFHANKKKVVVAILRQNKDGNKRQRKTLPNDHRNTSLCKATTESQKRRNQQKHNKECGNNTPLIAVDRSSI